MLQLPDTWFNHNYIIYMLSDYSGCYTIASGIYNTNQVRYFA